MEFEVSFTELNDIIFCFDEGECEPYEEDVAKTIIGKITTEGKKIGEIRLYRVYNDNKFYQICDDISEDMGILAGLICDESGCISKNLLFEGADEFDSVFVLDNITIDEEYRGNGIGSAIIANLQKMLEYKFEFCRIIFLQASDFETGHKLGFDSKEYIEGNKRLMDFYKKAGFKTVKENVMIYLKP